MTWRTPGAGARYGRYVPARRHRPAAAAVHRDAPACAMAHRRDGHGAAAVHPHLIRRPAEAPGVP